MHARFKLPSDINSLGKGTSFLLPSFLLSLLLLLLPSFPLPLSSPFHVSRSLFPPTNPLIPSLPHRSNNGYNTTIPPPSTSALNKGDTEVTLYPRDPPTRMVSPEKAFDLQLAKNKRVEDLRNGLQFERNGVAGGVERGEGETTSSMEVVWYVMAAFAVIVMFSFTVICFIFKLSGEDWGCFEFQLGIW